MADHRRAHAGWANGQETGPAPVPAQAIRRGTDPTPDHARPTTHAWHERLDRL
ncbi:hypothetical protein [Streptomyces sp. NPDC051001]|uniref:hypothetical protein n=1 Tax=Streptomyces sp. NPDC051001 TaxID=3155795 RepID=UPI00343858B1